MVGKILVAFYLGSSQWMCFVSSFYGVIEKDCGCILSGFYPLEAFHFIRVIAIFQYFGVIEQFVVAFYWNSTQYMCFMLLGRQQFV